MGHDDLKAVCKYLKFDGVDLRRRNDMATAISRSRRATTEILIERLDEAQIRAVCERVRVASRGGRAALIRRLFGGEEDSEEVNTSGSRTHGPRFHALGHGGDERAREEVTWMSADDALSSGSNAGVDTRSVSQPNPIATTGPKIEATELVWPRKYDDHARATEPPRISLPFQVIEVIEEGRASREALVQGTLPLLVRRGSHPEYGPFPLLFLSEGSDGDAGVSPSGRRISRHL